MTRWKNNKPAYVTVVLVASLVVCLAFSAPAQALTPCEQIVAAGNYDPADLNRDCFVNFDDLVLFANAWLESSFPANI